MRRGSAFGRVYALALLGAAWNWQLRGLPTAASIGSTVLLGDGMAARRRQW